MVEIEEAMEANKSLVFKKANRSVTLKVYTFSLNLIWVFGCFTRSITVFPLF